MNAPILVKAQVNQPFFLTTDASNSHIGGVLSQIQSDGSNKPIGYFSNKLSPCESRYSATDKEALAVVLACRNFHFLWGTRFTVITDHQPLTSIFKRKTKSPRMNRWILEMRKYNYEINYLKGKDNIVADHLSRPVRVVMRPPETSWLGLAYGSSGNRASFFSSVFRFTPQMLLPSHVKKIKNKKLEVLVMLPT